MRPPLFHYLGTIYREHIMLKWSQLALLGILLFLLAVSSGCVTMTSGQIQDYNEIVKLGLPLNPAGVAGKNPVLAGVCAVLIPGSGNVYLAINTQQSTQWTYAALNFLFSWTIVPYLVSIPAVIIDADTITKLEVLQYYHYDREGKALLEEARKRLKTTDPPSP